MGLLQTPDTLELDSIQPNAYKGFSTQDTIEFQVDPQNNLIDAKETIRIVDSMHNATGYNYTVKFSNDITLDESLVLHNCELIDTKIKLVEITEAIIMKDSSAVKGVEIDTHMAAPEKYKDNWGFAKHFVNKSVIRIEGTNCLVDSVYMSRIFGSGIEFSHAKNNLVKRLIVNGSWVNGYKHGTQGYGINFYESDSNLIQGCLIRGTRHGIVVQYNSDNNEIRYNVVKDSYALKKMWIFTWKDYMFTFDITVHGNNPSNNLIWQNYAMHRIYIDDEHLPNGIGNILYQNHAQNKIQIDKGNKKQYMISNYAPQVKDNGKNNIVKHNTVILWK